MYKATYTLGNVQCNGEDSDAQPATDESPADAEAVAAPRAHRRITYPNGIWYEGPLVNGKKSGRGVMGFPSGSRYEGDFVDDDLTGKGVYVNSDGYHYEGDFVDGVPNGKGASFVPNDSRYEGDFVDAKLDGKGVIVYANGNRYEGNWANNEMNGKGVMVFSNGDRYEGDWAGSKMNGKGVMVYANGDRHDGYWANGKKSGAPGSSNKNEGTGNAANAPALPAVTGSCDSKLNGGWLQGSRSGTYNWIEFNSAKNCFVYETNGSCATNYVYATSGTVLTLTIKARDFCPIRNRTISMSYRISDSGIFLGDDPVPYKKQQ